MNQVIHTVIASSWFWAVLRTRQALSLQNGIAFQRFCRGETCLALTCNNGAILKLSQFALWQNHHIGDGEAVECGSIFIGVCACV